MRVSTRPSDEPLAMFLGEHLSLSTYLTFIVLFPPVVLLLSVLRCSSFRTRDIPCSLILPRTHPITCCFVSIWTCVSQSLAQVLLRVAKYHICWSIAACLMLEMIMALLFVHFNY